jgi:hypothetical protein
MKSIVRVAAFLGVIVVVAPAMVGAQEADCSAQCNGNGTVDLNTATSASRASDIGANVIGEMVGDKTLSSVTTVVVAQGSLDDTSASSLSSAIAAAGGALDRSAKPTVEAAVSLGASLGGSIAAGGAGPIGTGTPLNASIMLAGPMAALGGALNGIASSH